MYMTNGSMTITATTYDNYCNYIWQLPIL